MTNAKLLNFPSYSHVNGKLCVYERGQNVPFDIHRVFTVTAKKGDVRGEHAHKKCSQILICLSGKICISCDDGLTINNYLLNDMSTGLLIPPGIWAKQEYVVGDSVLMVLCDHLFDADEYIHDYDDFLAYLKRNKK